MDDRFSSRGTSPRDERLLLHLMQIHTGTQRSIKADVDRLGGVAFALSHPWVETSKGKFFCSDHGRGGHQPVDASTDE